ncbi:MAG: 3-dehydroquinate synthase [Lachnospiraceae bacterium]|jgi:3-dehydroquinate synthase|nr:3-dehydroquinate synthase [Lachnospiraceae bacterium]
MDTYLSHEASFRRILVQASRSYEIIVGRDLLKDCGHWIRQIASPCVAVIVADDTVDGLYGDRVAASVEKEGIRALRYRFPHGEESKNPDRLFELLEFMAERSVTRTDLIIALGGGVTGDLTGFAASVYLRGTPFIQIPTTLLAAVDSSVGGKTAVNLKAGKNLAGTFNQPHLVLCDTDTLKTLPEQEFACGMAEVIKYGVLSDPALFRLLEQEDARDHLDSIICRCVSIKKDLVMEDEFDTGLRQLLNLGHTLAHAIEKYSGFCISHGQAVAMGLAAVARCAWASGLAKEDCSGRIEAVLGKYGLPVRCDYPVDRLCQAILKDKKRSGGTINLVIPQRIGDTCLHRIEVERLVEFYSSDVRKEEKDSKKGLTK